VCDFISWIEYKDEILFLTKNELETSRGKALRKYLGLHFENDVKGHGAIEWYYKLKDNVGKHKECTDFSNPKNFPAVIVKALKRGDFCGIGIPENYLTQPALAEYQKVTGQALAKYQKVTGQALAKYQKVTGQALAEYEKVTGQAWSEYEKVTGPARAEYQKVKGQALAENQKVTGQAWAEYEKVKGPALDEYQKVNGQAFWKIAKKKENRRKEWR